MKRHEILGDAANLIDGIRDHDYGTPLDNHQRIAALWSVVLEQPVTPAQVALCMILVKAARLVQTPDHYDSVVDICGYAAIYGEIVE